MTRQRRYTFGTLSLLAFVLAYAAPASAVPMWTRRYGVSCSTCHAFPSLQLSEAGLDFFRRGHRMSGDTFPKSVTDLVSAHGEWEHTVEEHSSTAFQSPEFHLHAGGAVAEYFSAYADANVNSDFETIYLQYTKPHGEDSYFTTRIGKLMPTIVRNYGSGLMASASTPLILTDTTLGDNPFNPARGSLGVDIAGRLKSFFLQGGIVNGEDVPGQAAVSNHKDIYASAEFNTPGSPTGVGLYYYRGGYDLGSQETGFVRDRYDRYGVFANFTKEHFRLAGAYLFGKDILPEVRAPKLRGFYVQADLNSLASAVPFARYDDVRTELDDSTTRVRKLSVGCSFQLFQNEFTAGRAVLEISRRREANASVNAGLVNLIWAF